MLLFQGCLAETGPRIGGMPKLYFDVREGDTVTADDRGHECASEDAVERHAALVVAGIVTAELAMSRRLVKGAIEVRDASDVVRRRFRFGYAMKAEWQDPDTPDVAASFKNR